MIRSIASTLLVAAALAQADVLHLAIRGDLDSTQLANDAVAALREHQSASAIVIELDGNRWRPDVVHTIAGGIVESRSPVGVLLMDRRDKRVGLGPLMLAMVANGCVIDRHTKAASEPSEMLPARGDEQHLARIDRELGGWLWVALDRSGLSPALGEAMAYRDTSLDAMLDDQGAWTLAPADPNAQNSEPFLVVDADRAAGVRADATMLRSLNLVSAIGRHPRDTLKAMRVPPERLIRIEVTSDLAEAGDEIDRRLAKSDACLRNAQRIIDQHRDRTRGVELPRTFIEQATAATIGQLTEASEHLLAAEALLERHPELLDRPAPVGTPVARSEQQNTRDWRSIFLERRDDIDRLKQLAHRLD